MPHEDHEAQRQHWYPLALDDGLPAPPLVVRPRSDSGRLHAAKLVLQVPDLIANPGGQLELKLGRCRVHLLGELGDEGCKIRASWSAALVAGRGRSCPRRHAGDRRLATALL